MTIYNMTDSTTAAKKTIRNDVSAKPVAWVTKSEGHGWDVTDAKTGKTVHFAHMPKPRDSKFLVDQGITAAQDQAAQVIEILNA